MIAGLVLAAGDGSRFAGPIKQLAELGGRPLLEHAVRAACAVPELERVLVVLGANAAEITAAVEFGRAETLVCEDWADGQSGSLRAGAGILRGSGARRVIVTLGDAPLIGPAVITRFIGQPPRARAVYHGRPGHPVVLGPDELGAISSLSGDRGAAGLLAGGPQIECSDLGSSRDVDTLEDLEAIRHEARAVL